MSRPTLNSTATEILRLLKEYGTLSSWELVRLSPRIIKQKTIYDHLSKMYHEGLVSSTLDHKGRIIYNAKTAPKSY